MSRVLIPSPGPESWRQFLAQPELHWVTGFSAKTLAYAWDNEHGIPSEVAQIIEAHFEAVQPLVIIPEHKTSLPGGSRESQSDVFLLARHSQGTIACTIEGKVDEPFGPTVGQQIALPTPGKAERLTFLCERLGLEHCPAHIHYQLLHRTVSALIEAERFDARDAAMIVHSFSPERRWFEAFAAFAELLGADPQAPMGSLIEMGKKRLLLGWASGDARFREI